MPPVETDRADGADWRGIALHPCAHCRAVRKRCGRRLRATHDPRRYRALHRSGAVCCRMCGPSAVRWLAIGFATLMCIESLLLITYTTKDCHGTLGYRPLQPLGARTSGTVSRRSGATRAELTYDNSNQTSRSVTCWIVLKINRPATPSIPRRTVNVMIARGYSEVSVPLESDRPVQNDAHFRRRRAVDERHAGFFRAGHRPQ